MAMNKGIISSTNATTPALAAASAAACPPRAAADVTAPATPSTTKATMSIGRMTTETTAESIRVASTRIQKPAYSRNPAGTAKGDGYIGGIITAAGGTGCIGPPASVKVGTAGPL